MQAWHCIGLPNGCISCAPTFAVVEAPARMIGLNRN